MWTLVPEGKLASHRLRSPAKSAAGYLSSIDTPIPQKGSVEVVKIDMNFEETSRLELIALHAGKLPAQVLIEAARYLLDHDAGCCEHCRPAQTQKFLPDDEMEARFARILRHPSHAQH